MSELDCFLAKKSKKKTKPNIFSPDEVAKKLEEAEKKEVQRYKKEEQKRKQERYEQLDAEFSSTAKTEADEWKEEVEEEVDLTDLNIQQLDNKQGKNSEQLSEKSVERNVTRTPCGPWSKVPTSSCPESDEEESDKQHGASSDTTGAPAHSAPVAHTPAPTGVYVPLHRRNQMAGATPGGPSSLTPVKLSGRVSRRAPDITSSEAFPSLGSSGQDDSDGPAGESHFGRSDEGFRQVKHGGASSSTDQRATRSSLTLGNQFNALRLNDAS